jgi:hypothetical protein
MPLPDFWPGPSSATRRFVDVAGSLANTCDFCGKHVARMGALVHTRNVIAGRVFEGWACRECLELEPRDKRRY